MSQAASPTRSRSRPPSVASHHPEHELQQEQEDHYRPRRGRSLSLSSRSAGESSQSPDGRTHKRRGRSEHPVIDSDAEDETRALQRRERKELESRRVADKGDRYVEEKPRTPVRLRLDMDLDIEVEVKAKIKGDITLSLLSG